MSACSDAACKLAEACASLHHRTSGDSSEAKAQRQALACSSMDMAACMNTALARTGACDELLRRCADTGACGSVPQEALYEFVPAGSALEETIVLDAVLEDAADAALARRGPLRSAVAAALRHVEGDAAKLDAAVHAVLSTVAGSGAACVALVDGDVSALTAALSDDVLQAELGDAMYTQLLLPDTLAAVSRAREAPFLVGAVDGHATPALAAAPRFLRGLQRNLVHGSCKNFVLHTQKHTSVAVGLSPDVKQHQIDEEVFAELWRIRSRRRGAERSIEGTTAAIAAVLRTQLAAQLREGPEQRAVVDMAVANTSATVQSLLSDFRHVFLPREKCTDVATHVIAIQPGVFAAIIALETPGACMPASVRVQAHSIVAAAQGPLWAPGSGDNAESVWHLLSLQATSALSSFLHRARASTACYPGAQVLKDLVAWLQRVSFATSPVDGSVAAVRTSGAPAQLRQGLLPSAQAMPRCLGRAAPGGALRPAAAPACNVESPVLQALARNGPNSVFPGVQRPPLQRQIAVTSAGGE